MIVQVESGREKLVERGPLSLSMSAESVITARVRGCRSVT